MYISFLKTTDIRFKDGMRDEKYADESTLSERVFDVSKGSNLNPKEATSPRSVWTRTCHDTRAIFFPIRREIESVFRKCILFDYLNTEIDAFMLENLKHFDSLQVEDTIQ